MASAKKKQKAQELSLDDEDYVRRAIAAWFRGGGFNGGGGFNMPSVSGSAVVEHASKCYVVLRNGGGVVAVYRIRNDEMLKRMKRWPKGVE